MPRTGSSVMGTVRDLGHVHVVSRQPRTLPAETEADGEDGHGEQPESSHARTRSRRYLESKSGCLRCKRRGYFACIFLRGGRVTWTASPPQAWHESPCRCAFRGLWSRAERSAMTCKRRRRPGQARHGQGRLQITAVLAPAQAIRHVGWCCAEQGDLCGSRG